MIFRNRPLVRLGIAALFASGVVAGLSAPAYADGLKGDLVLDVVVGTKVAAGAEYKVAFAKIKNLGPGKPDGGSITLNASKVDPDKVLVAPITDNPCVFDNEGVNPEGYQCLLNAEDLPEPGATVEMPLLMFKPKPDVELPYSAPITVTVHSQYDPNEANNTATAMVELSDQSGADLVVLADDVKNAVQVKKGRIEVAGDLHAGDTGQLIYTVWNQGDLPTAGLKVSVTLPKGVTFTETEDECEYDAAKTSLVCTYPNLPFIPQDQDTEDGDDETAGGRFYHLLSVNEDVKAGTLTGGAVSVEPILPAKGLKAQSTEIKNLPDNMTAAQAPDLDVSDNSDGYAVVVAAGDGAGGGTGGGNDDGGLPVTGPQAGLIGGIGVAVLAAGGAMFLVARRRRVVLVTPGDERPAA